MPLSDPPADFPGVKYPEVTVPIEPGENVFGIIGRTMTALRRAGVPKDQIDAYHDEARAGTYEDAITTTRRWVAVA